MKKGERVLVFVFPSASLPLALAPLSIVIHEPDLHAPVLVCACVSEFVNPCCSK